MAKKKSSKKSNKNSYTPSYVSAVAPVAPSYVPTAVAPGPYTSTAVAPAPYVSTANAPAPYAPTAKAPEAYQAGTYNSQYADQLSGALNTVTNWKYDPMSDANYQALAKVYGARGNIAAKNSLADAAALNGGYGTSYAVSAAQQARNQYNQELAALIPDLEANAFNKATTTLNALRDADDTVYGRFRDTESDRQWKYGQDYNAYRDQIADSQWKYGQDYQAYRDKEADNQWKYNTAYNAYRDKEADNQWRYNTAYNTYRDQIADDQWYYSQNYNRYQDALSQYQWALDYNNTLYAQNQAAKKSGGGGGGRKSSGGGGGYSSVGGGSGIPITQEDFNSLKNTQKQGPAPSMPVEIRTGASFASRIADNIKKKK